MKQQINYYTLLYINENETSLGNGLSGKYSEKIEKYVNCCFSLNSSLILHNQPKLKVITNNAELINKIDNEKKELQFKLK